MDRDIRILIIDDNPLDRELVRDSLTREPGRFTLSEASTREEFDRILTEHVYDLVLTDLNILGYSGLDVLATVRSKLPDVPVIVVTGTGSESIAVEAMKGGADDYVIKTTAHLRRLPDTIRSVLERRRSRCELDAAREALRKSEERFRKFAENARDLMYRIVFDPTQRFEYVSASATVLTGYTPEDHYADPDLGMKLVHPDDRRILEAATRGEIDPELPLVLRWVRRDGEIIWTEQSNVFVYDDRGRLEAIEGVARDITIRKLAEERIKRLNRMLSVLSTINGAIVRIHDPDILFRRVCEIAVEQGGFAAVWIERVDLDTGDMMNTATLIHTDASPEMIGSVDDLRKLAAVGTKRVVHNDLTRRDATPRKTTDTVAIRGAFASVPMPIRGGRDDLALALLGVTGLLRRGRTRADRRAPVGHRFRSRVRDGREGAV